jgi:K+-transporting ATPase KdpF subunit
MGPDSALRPPDGSFTMSGVELVGLIVSTGLLFYLFAALLKPEWFS